MTGRWFEPSKCQGTFSSSSTAALKLPLRPFLTSKTIEASRPSETSLKRQASLRGAFFFYCSRDHRDLHSFPTRRSSDLTARIAPAVRPVPPTPLSSRSPVNVAMTRSEEHTSELQSQSNLVCRLLLEK